MKRYFNISQSIGEEVRCSHVECKDTRDRLYIRRTPKGYLYHCFNCGWAGFKPLGDSSSTSIDYSREYLSNIKNANKETFIENKKILLPYDFTYEIPYKGKLWLDKYYITEDEIKRYRFGYSEKMNRLILPLYDPSGELIYWQGRNLNKPTKDSPKYINVKSRKSSFCIFGSGPTCVLVEDILSAIKVGRVTTCIPLLGSYISTNMLTFINKYETILIWLDEDKRFDSLKYSKKIRIFTGKPCRSIITELDPKEYNTENIYNIIFNN